MPLEAGGYYYQQGSTLNLSVDAGFKKRQRLFLNEGSQTVYSGEAVTLCGPIYHDLISCEGCRTVQPGQSNLDYWKFVCGPKLKTQN